MVFDKSVSDPANITISEDSVDCCEVSKRFGGGGHAGAAGFVIDVSSDQFKDFLESKKLLSK